MRLPGSACLAVPRPHGSSRLAAPQFAHSPGWKIALPSNARDAKGLFKSAIRDNNPVIFLYHGALGGSRGEVPNEEYTIPFGLADIKREGSDVTLVAIGWMVPRSLEVAATLANEGISVEVIDPRTLAPLDTGR